MAIVSSLSTIDELNQFSAVFLLFFFEEPNILHDLNFHWNDMCRSRSCIENGQAAAGGGDGCCQMIWHRMSQKINSAPIYVLVLFFFCWCMRHVCIHLWLPTKFVLSTANICVDCRCDAFRPDAYKNDRRRILMSLRHFNIPNAKFHQ